MTQLKIEVVCKICLRSIEEIRNYITLPSKIHVGCKQCKASLFLDTNSTLFGWWSVDQSPSPTICVRLTFIT